MKRKTTVLPSFFCKIITEAHQRFLQKFRKVLPKLADWVRICHFPRHLLFVDQRPVFQLTVFVIIPRLSVSILNFL